MRATANGNGRCRKPGVIEAPGVARGRVFGSSLAGGFPGSRATAGGTRRRCRQVAIETPGVARARVFGLAMIVIGRPRERLTSFTDRGAWLHGVGRGRMVGGALAGRLPGSRASASGTGRRCRQGAIETPSLPELRGRLWR